jgi:hypothetical protein
MYDPFGRDRRRYQGAQVTQSEHARPLRGKGTNLFTHLAFHHPDNKYYEVFRKLPALRP